MRVLSLCDRTGVMVKPWLDDGAECWIVDLQHPAGVRRATGAADTIKHTGLFRVGADVRTWTPPSDWFDIVFAFPPCTHLAGSGARWWASKGLPALITALSIVEACRAICEASGAPWMIENPVGRLSTCWREPDYTFDPWEYGDDYTKRTCLWTGGGFVMPPKVRAGDLFAAPTEHQGPIDKTRIHHASPGPERANIRSITPAGFARAVYEANAPRIRERQSA
jgi:hypothetical protein